MTRSFLIIIGIIVVLCLGLHFYTQWETKRFEASFPKPPATNEAATKGTVEAEDTIKHPEKVDLVTRGRHKHGAEWHATSHPSEFASDEIQEQPVPEEYSQLIVPNIEVSEPIEDPIVVELHAEKLELEQLQVEINDRADGFRKALNAQSISVDEANAIYEELNRKLQYLRERRYQWWLKYAEHPEADVPEYWGNPEIIDEAAASIKEQEVEKEAASGGYIISPRTNP